MRIYAKRLGTGNNRKKISPDSLDRLIGTPDRTPTATDWSWRTTELTVLADGLELDDLPPGPGDLDWTDADGGADGGLRSIGIARIEAATVLCPDDTPSGVHPHFGVSG
jgi:hypothetical protein